MSLILAPYNDGLRLGMGFNSYTQSPCIDKAVKVSLEESPDQKHSPPQIVSYSSRFVEKLSDILSAANVSYGASIKKGTVEIAGNAGIINEDNIKESDLNAVVTVRVVNQTVVLHDDCEFMPLESNPNGPKTQLVPGSPRFNSIYGDCYISGFIEGGDFLGVISIKVLDKLKKDDIKKTINQRLSSGSEKDEWTLDSVNFALDDAATSSLRDTETTVSVSWMGGGQIKDSKAAWDINTMTAAAAEFPDNVATCPQRTWAILTKYTANRSFIEWSLAQNIQSFSYENVTAYTANLFEDYMEYKTLVNLIDDVRSHPDSYGPSTDEVLPTDVKTLADIKAAIQFEMNQIVLAVDVISHDPTSLNRRKANPLDNAKIKSILSKAGLRFPAAKGDDNPKLTGIKSSAAATGLLGVADGSAPPATHSSDSNRIPISTPSSTGSPERPLTTQSGSVTAILSRSQLSTTLLEQKDNPVQLEFDFDSLIAPEVFSAVLPVLKRQDKATDHPSLSNEGFAPPPSSLVPWDVNGKVVGASVGGRDASTQATTLFDAWKKDPSNKGKAFTINEKLKSAAGDVTSMTSNQAVILAEIWVESSGQQQMQTYVQYPFPMASESMTIDFNIGFLFPMASQSMTVDLEVLFVHSSFVFSAFPISSLDSRHFAILKSERAKAADYRLTPLLGVTQDPDAEAFMDLEFMHPIMLLRHLLFQYKGGAIIGYVTTYTLDIKVFRDVNSEGQEHPIESQIVNLDSGEAIVSVVSATAGTDNDEALAFLRFGTNKGRIFEFNSVGTSVGTGLFEPKPIPPPGPVAPPVTAPIPVIKRVSEEHAPPGWVLRGFWGLRRRNFRIVGFGCVWGRPFGSER